MTRKMLSLASYSTKYGNLSTSYSSCSFMRTHKGKCVLKLARKQFCKNVIVQKALSSVTLAPTNALPTFASRVTSPCIKKVMSAAMTMYGYGSTISLMG
jgi:hypothetical protein